MLRSGNQQIEAGNRPYLIKQIDGEVLIIGQYQGTLGYDSCDQLQKVLGAMCGRDR